MGGTLGRSGPDPHVSAFSPRRAGVATPIVCPGNASPGCCHHRPSAVSTEENDMATTTSRRHDYAAVNPAAATASGQWLALAVGLAFTLAGIAGFAVTGFSGFAAHHGGSLLGFDVNPL